jgi:hypothetical protein
MKQFLSMLTPVILCVLCVFTVVFGNHIELVKKQKYKEVDNTHCKKEIEFCLVELEEFKNSKLYVGQLEQCLKNTNCLCNSE